MSERPEIRGTSSALCFSRSMIHSSQTALRRATPAGAAPGLLAQPDLRRARRQHCPDHFTIIFPMILGLRRVRHHRSPGPFEEQGLVRKNRGVLQVSEPKGCFGERRAVVTGPSQAPMTGTKSQESNVPRISRDRYSSAKRERLQNGIVRRRVAQRYDMQRHPREV